MEVSGETTPSEASRGATIVCPRAHRTPSCSLTIPRARVCSPTDPRPPLISYTHTSGRAPQQEIPTVPKG